ncbi:hypothetical protein ACF3OH_02410 [Chryseomicrobium aureum]|uniref:hypothetical protein n=1 Tax=Chryseomicrobium aureum TaxID=1441723 RepID=UPI00370D9111
MKMMKGAFKAFLMMFGTLLILIGFVLIALNNEAHSTVQMIGTKLSGVVLVGLGMFMGFDDYFKKQQQRKEKRNRVVGD